VSKVSLYLNTYFVLFEFTIKGSFNLLPLKSSIIESIPIPLIVLKLIPIGDLFSKLINPIVILLVFSEPSMHISSFSHEIITNNVSNILKTLVITSLLISFKISIFM